MVLMLGMLMVPVAVLFGLAAAAPGRTWRRRVALVTVCLLWGVGLLGLLGMAVAAAVIPGQNYPDNDVLMSHVLALGICLALIGWAVVAYARPGYRLNSRARG